MKKRTIERKSKDGFLNSMAKNLGLKPKDEQKAETVREFDDLIETLRTGKFHALKCLTLMVNSAIYLCPQVTFFTEAKSTKDRVKRKVAIHRPATIDQTVKTLGKGFFKRHFCPIFASFLKVEPSDQ